MKNSMVEPSLYGYFEISEDCFLVRSEVLEGNRALHMLKFVDDDPLVHPEEESIISDAIKHVLSLSLDRRSKMSIGIDELSSSEVPINVFHSVLFRRRAFKSGTSPRIDSRCTGVMTHNSVRSSGLPHDHAVYQPVNLLHVLVIYRFHTLPLFQGSAVLEPTAHT